MWGRGQTDVRFDTEENNKKKIGFEIQSKVLKRSDGDGRLQLLVVFFQQNQVSLIVVLFELKNEEM